MTYFITDIGRSVSVWNPQTNKYTDVPRFTLWVIRKGEREPKVLEVAHKKERLFAEYGKDILFYSFIDALQENATVSINEVLEEWERRLRLEAKDDNERGPGMLYAITALEQEVDRATQDKYEVRRKRQKASRA